MTSMSRLSTEYVQVQVSFTVAGAASDPTGDVAQMAFVPPGAIPASGDWHTASWETVGAAHYAQCLVGPSGDVVLRPGTYTVWVKITDSPEIPVRSPSQLTIT